MAIGRALRGLALYDILTNLMPGIVLTAAILLILPINQEFKSIPGGILIAVFLAFAFVSGHVAQFVGSWREGTPTTFSKTMRAVKANCPNHAPIRVTHIEESFLEKCREEFGYPEDFNDYGRLLQLILSHLETTSHTRALRFQTVHAFHRSMWAVSEIVSVISGLLLLGNLATGTLVRSWGIAIGILITSLVARWIFNNRREKFDRAFIEYVIIDFFDDVTTHGTSSTE